MSALLELGESELTTAAYVNARAATLHLSDRYVIVSMIPQMLLIACLMYDNDDSCSPMLASIAAFVLVSQRFGIGTLTCPHALTDCCELIH
jgi:hypothetical protein